MSQQSSNVVPSVMLGDLRRALNALDWEHGLTRQQVRRKCRMLPHSVYLRLPDSKRYYAARDLLHDAQISASRAEGEFLGPAPNLPEDEARDEGGPPAWGPSPMFTPGGAVDGTSAEDRTPVESGE